MSDEFYLLSFRNLKLREIFFWCGSGKKVPSLDIYILVWLPHHLQCLVKLASLVFLHSLSLSLARLFSCSLWLCMLNSFIQYIIQVNGKKKKKKVYCFVFHRLIHQSLVLFFFQEYVCFIHFFSEFLNFSHQHHFRCPFRFEWIICS